MVLKCILPPTIAFERVKEIHAFDLDRTLASCNTSLLFARYLKKKGVINYFQWLGCIWGYCLYRLGFSSMSSQMRKTFSHFFKGKSVDVIESFLPSFWQDSLCKEMRQSLCSHLALLQKNGKITAIFSASPDFLVEWMAQKLKVNFVLGSECQINTAKKTFLDLGMIATGLVKSRALDHLKYLFPKAKTYGYSDSSDDIEFLESVDHPFIVDPDSKLQLWANNRSGVILWK